MGRQLAHRRVVTMKIFLTTLAIMAIMATTTMASESYEGYQVLRTSPLTAGAAALLRELQLTTNTVDFWREPVVGRHTDISTPPHLLDNIKEMLASKGVEVSVMIEDLEKLIQDTKPSNKSVKSEGKRYAMNWDDYQRHDVLNEFIESIADANDFASIIPIGQSYEGRDMKVLAITKAFSEVEMQNIRDFVMTLDPVPVVGWCFHSYSQLWLWPYGYAYNAYPDNYLEIKQLAEDASDALYQVHGTIFDPINSAELYPAAGAADDWYKSIGMRHVFTTELRDTGYYGFVLPPEQIIPSGEEMWAGFETVVNKVLADMQ